MSSDKSNLRDDFLKAANGEPIEAVYVEREYLDDLCNVDARWAAIPVGRALAWDDVASLLDQEYDTDYGLQDCPDILAWTPTAVLYVYEYDGSTEICRMLRNPPTTSGEDQPPPKDPP